jgi:hypothetical protein
VFARDLRLTLMCERLDRDSGADGDLLDPGDAVRVLDTAAESLAAWYADGRRSARRPGRLRRHRARPLSAFTQAWATAPIIVTALASWV